MEVSTVPLRDAVTRAVIESNWYAGLLTALTLPDIIGRIEDPSATPGARYTAWFNDFVGPKYKSAVGGDPTPTVFLSGVDCYALRCALLHEGSGSLAGQRAHQSLEDIVFVEPVAGRVVHRHRSPKRLVLQVDLFCLDIVTGVVAWEKLLPTKSPEIQRRAAGLLQIQTGSYTI